jgi:undecaprenyl diphosphate synthase
MENTEKKMNIPEHIAIIMDGNGRWAKKRDMVRVAGHNAGMKSLKETVRSCGGLGVSYLTVYAFSTENWKRPEDEVSGIFKIMVHYIKKELNELNNENVRVNVIGNWSVIPADAKKSMLDAVEKTKNNTGLVFTIALNYGGRRDIADAVQALAKAKAAEGRDIESLFEIDESELEKYISTSGMPDPDIIIRTGGEMRLSNFLLWQCAYSEFIFTDKYWPDFDRNELERCIEIYNSRHRRYGGL